MEGLLHTFCAVGSVVTSARQPGQNPVVNEHSWSRAAVVRGLLVVGMAYGGTKPADGAYTVVPTGRIDEKEARLRDVNKLYAETPNDPYVFGEKAQLEYDLNALKYNQDFSAKLTSELRSGKGHFIQRLTIPVDDMNSAVQFWTRGAGALVRSSRLVNGMNVTVVGFGPESLRLDDGAKFSLELVEAGADSGPNPLGEQLEYLQLAMPVFRLSQVMAYGGKIESAYGWTLLTAPGGVQLRVKIDETRRDPFEFVAFRVSNLKAAIKHYEAQGMQSGEPYGARKLNKKFSIESSNSIFEAGDAFEPEREIGSVLMNYGDPFSSTGLLLVPPLSRKKLALGKPEPRIRVVGEPPAGVPLQVPVRSPDGLAFLFDSEDGLERSLQIEQSS